MDKEKRDNVVKLAGSLAKENISELKRKKREKQRKWLLPVAVLVITLVAVSGWFLYQGNVSTTVTESVVSNIETMPVPADAELLKNFSALAVKRLSATEISTEVSNQHEFNGVKSFQDAFGTEKQRFRGRFVYFGKGGKTFSSDASLTWYDASRDPETEIYRLYYSTNPVIRAARPGDALFIAKYADDQLIAVVAQQESAAEQQLFTLFSIEDDIPRSGLKVKGGDGDTVSVKKVLMDQLQQTGKVPIEVDIWKDVETGEISISGHVDKVKDGDTLNLSEIFDVRLLGIDTPEKKQTCMVDGKKWECGQAAKKYLESLVAGKEVRCTNKKKEKYGRFLSICEAGGTNLNEAMVKKGLAVIYYSDMYADLEKEARLNEVGLWGSEFITPNEWRKGIRN